MKIKIEKFEGPLDLLLQLIEQERLDITEISLAHVTEQFLQILRSRSDLRPQELAGWLNIAAKLLVIKSKVLVPSLEIEEEEQEDVTSLAWQLYYYKCFKEAARSLRTFDQGMLKSWGREASFAEKISFYPDPSLTTETLRDAMRYLAKTLAEITKLPEKVLEEVVTITEKIDHVQRQIAEKVEMRLRDLLKSAKSKTEVIVTFLALLELTKQKILTIEQEAIFSDIIIRKHQPGAN